MKKLYTQSVEEVLSGLGVGAEGLTSAEAEAYYCADCGMVFAPVPEKVEGTIDKLKKKLTDISEKREAAAEERKIRQEEERREREREKRAKKDPWER